MSIETRFMKSTDPRAMFLSLNELLEKYKPKITKELASDFLDHYKKHIRPSCK